MCQPFFFIHLRQGKYSPRPEIYGRVESGLVYTALVLIPLWGDVSVETVTLYLLTKVPTELSKLAIWGL